MCIHVHSSTAIEVLAGPLTFPEALDVQPRSFLAARFQDEASRMTLPMTLPSSCLLLMELRSSCCRTEAPSSCRRPAESGRSPAGTPRRLLCSPWGPLEAASHAPLDLQMSPALLPPGRGSLQGLTKRDCRPGEPRRHSITNSLCRVSLALSTTQSQLQKKQGLSVFRGHDSTGLVPMDWKRKRQG